MKLKFLLFYKFNMKNQHLFAIEIKAIHLGVILSFLTLLLAFNQPWVTSMDGDSIVYFTISKTISVDGNWLNPFYDGKPFYDHPPLVLWVNAILFKILGDSEWVAKLFSGFSGLGVVLLTFYVGSKYENIFLGFYAALSMLLTYDFIKYLNKCRFDMPLVFFYAIALFSFLEGTEGKKNRFYLAGIFTGLSFLTKGVVFFGIFLTALIFIVSFKRIDLIRKKEIWLGFLLSLIIPFIWFFVQFMVNGPEFFDKYFIQQVYESIKGRSRPYSVFYYFFHILKVYWPWLPFLIHGFYISLKDDKKNPLWVMSIAWSSVIFISFSIVKFKIHYYLLPMFPAVSLLTAKSLDNLLSAHKKIIGIKIFSIIAITASLFLAILPIPLHHNRYPEISKMAPYLKDIFTDKDLIIGYRCNNGINTPVLNLISSKLNTITIHSYIELKEILIKNISKRIFLFTSEHIAKEEPIAIQNFYPFIEYNGFRFYSQNPNQRLSRKVF